MVGWLNEALIGSEDVIRSLRERRILGADRKVIDSADEMSLSPSRGVVLLSVDPSPQFVRPDRKLVITNTSDRVGVRRPAQIVLYVANEGGG
jgi:type VI secretion system protein ImpJ